MPHAAADALRSRARRRFSDIEYGALSLLYFRFKIMGIDTLFSLLLKNFMSPQILAFTITAILVIAWISYVYTYYLKCYQPLI